MGWIHSMTKRIICFTRCFSTTHLPKEDERKVKIERLLIHYKFVTSHLLSLKRDFDGIRTKRFA